MFDLKISDKYPMVPLKRNSAITRIKAFIDTALPVIVFVFAPTLFAIESQAESAGCRKNFEHLTFSSIDLKTPRIAKFLNSRAIERLQSTQPEAFKKLETFISTPPTKIPNESVAKSSLNFKDDSLRAELSLERESDTLTVNLDYIALVHNQEHGSQKLQIGDENPSLHMGFPRFITALADGLNQQVAADPSVRRIVIEGKFVVSQDLAEQLRAFGFESKPTLTSLSNMTKKGAAGPAAFLNSILQVLIPTFPETGSTAAALKGMSAGSAAVMKIRSAFRNSLTGRDWKLVLELEDPLATGAAATAPN